MKKILFLSIILFIAGKLNAQVTIGSGNEPQQGALLDIKENNDVLGGATSDKGMIFPRVSLVSLTELFPMLTGLETDYELSKLGYKGMIVYNVNATLPFSDGLYIWNGVQWNSLSTIIGALNGLTINGNSVKLGGTLNENTTISQDSHDLVISNTTGGTFKVNGIVANAVIPGATPAVEIAGKVVMTMPGELDGDVKRMVINNDGEVGIETTGSIQSLMTYAQSPNIQAYAVNSATTTSFNAGTPILVSFAPVDIVINAITTFDPITYEFTILTDGVYEVSGYVNYQPSSNGTNYTTLNAIVQYQDNASSTWNELSLSRMVYSGPAMKDISSTVFIPPAAIQMQAGFKIRMVLTKPIGDDHGNFGSLTWGIKLPTGGRFSRAIRIVAI